MYSCICLLSPAMIVKSVRVYARSSLLPRLVAGKEPQTLKQSAPPHLRPGRETDRKLSARTDDVLPRIEAAESVEGRKS